MKSVLIVDDEKYICNLIYHLTDWKTLKLECAGIVTDSEQAYELAVKKRPDIIISDIQMPGMSGLDLIKKLQAKGLKSRFIIITGYKTFDYAYTAIKIGVKHFLLKPINKAELNDTLQETCTSLQSISADNKKTITRSPSTISRRKLLLNIIQSRFPQNISDIQMLNNRYKYNFTNAPLQFGILWLTRGSLPDGFRHDALHRLARHFQRKMRPLCHDFELIDHNGQIYFIMNCSEKNASEGTSAFLQDAAVLFEPYPFLQYVLGLGKRACQPQEIIQSYESAAQAIASRVFYGYNNIIDASTLSLTSESPTPICTDTWKEIDISLDILDRKRLQKAITKLCEQMLDYFSKNPALTLDWFKATAITILNKFTEIHNASQQVVQQNISLVPTSIEDCENYDALTNCLCEIVLNTFEMYSNKKEINDNISIQTAKNYIHENYSQALDLASVAKQVYLSPTYFGILFKKETGDTFTNYLFEIRMETAKEKLQNLQYAISEIANMVGYKNTKYFSRQFKKHFGISPAQYRKLSHSHY